MTETTNEPSPLSQGPRKRGGRWRMPAALVLLAIIGGVACLPGLLSDPDRMSRFVAGALPDLDGDVTFRSVRVGWMGPIVLEDVRVVPRDGMQPPLAVARIEVGNGLAAILASLGDLGTVRVLGLEADVVFDERRQSNLSGLVRPTADDGARPGGRKPSRSPVRMRLIVEDAIVRIAGPWSPEPWRSDPLDVRATLAPAADGTHSTWTIAPVELLADARLEPGVAQGVLAYIAPVLADATRTSGRFSLRLDGAVLPVGRPADGRLSGELDMHEVAVGPGPLVENLLELLPVGLPRAPDIRIADESRVVFHMADRRVTHDGLEFGLPLMRPDQRLDIRSSGSVGIDDGALDLTLRLPIPADLPGNRPVLAALAGKSISVGIRGALGEPNVVFDGSIKEAAGEFLGDLVDRFGAGRTGMNPDAEGGPTAAGDNAEAVTDLVVGILEEVARRRAERRAAEAANPETPPPRRPRDRLRGTRERGPVSRP